ncbi:hypothetical protein STEG23_015166, partial [Scotinomys teguina]
DSSSQFTDMCLCFERIWVEFCEAAIKEMNTSVIKVSGEFLDVGLSAMNFPLSTAFIVSHRFGFNVIDLSTGWNLPSSAFRKAGFVDSWYSSPSSLPIIRMLGLFMVSQISWTFCFMTFWDLVFSLTDESISSILLLQSYSPVVSYKAEETEVW